MSSAQTNHDDALMSGQGTGARAKKSASLRLEDIDCAKGLAIILVIIGHMVAKKPPVDNEWVVYLRHAIYEFHMPFFLYLSGVVMFYKFPKIDSLKDYGRYVLRRADRLLVPFFSFGLFFVFGKMIATKMGISVDNDPSGLIDGLENLFWFTYKSPAVSIWYLFALFVFNVAMIPLMRITGNRAWIFALLGIPLFFAPVPVIMYMNKAAFCFAFFMIGGVCGQHYKAWCRILDRAPWLYVAIFLAILIETELGLLPVVGTFLSAATSLPALHALVRSSLLKGNKTLLFLGSYSMIIYLLNTAFIGIVKGGLMFVTSWNGLHFLFFVPCLLAAGLLGPIILKKLVLCRIPILDRYTS